MFTRYLYPIWYAILEQGTTLIWQLHIRVTNTKYFLPKLYVNHNGLLIYTEFSAHYCKHVSKNKRVITGFEHGTLWAINGTWDVSLSITTYGCSCQNCDESRYFPQATACLTLHGKSLCSQKSTNTAWVRARLCKLQKGCTRLASDKVYQLLAHGRWFSLGTPASSFTKTGHHDIAESGIKHNKSNQSNQDRYSCKL